MANKNNAKYDFLFSKEEKEKIKDDYVKNFFSIREVCKKYDIKSNMWVRKLLYGLTRNVSESRKIAYQKYPERFKHTDSSKAKIREARLQYMKEHPNETAWRKRNKPSYPEEMFIKFLTENEYDKKYYIEREYSIFPYYIDFAFVNEKIAIEIDGSQHLEEDRKNKDEKKDNILKEQGWSVIRITEHVIKTDWDIIKEKIDGVLSLKKEDKISYTKVGILRHVSKPHEKVARNEMGLSEKMFESSIKQRKVERPSKEDLFDLLKEYKNFTKVSRQFNVCDKTIVKWCKWYDLPTKINAYKS